jgi:hypothetical protein
MRGWEEGNSEKKFFHYIEWHPNSNRDLDDRSKYRPKLAKYPSGAVMNLTFLRQKRHERSVYSACGAERSSAR